MSTTTHQGSGPSVSGQPNVRFVNWIMDVAVVITCCVSAVLTAGGLKTVMENESEANLVALAIAFVSSAVWLALNHWYPFANKATKKSVNWGILAFAILMLFGSTLFSVITMGGRDAIAIHEQTVLQDARDQGLKYLQQGERELNLVPPLKTYAQIFRGLSDRETHGDVSGITGAGLVVASLRNTAAAFDSFASSVESTHAQRVESYKRLEAALNEGQDLVIQQQQTKGDFAKYQDLQVKFSTTVGNLNKELAKLAGLTSTRFLQEANGNLENLTSIIGKGNEAQNNAITRLKQPVMAAQTTLQRLIADNKAVGNMSPPSFTMIPMGYAIFVYARVIAFAWALGVLLDFLPMFFLFFKARFYEHFQNTEFSRVLKIFPGRIEKLRNDLEATRRARGYNENIQQWQQYNPRVQQLKQSLEEAESELRRARLATE